LNEFILNSQVPPAHYNGVSKGEFLSCEVFFDIKWTSAFHFRVEVFAGNSFNSRFSRYIPFSDAAFASHSVCVLPYINGWKVVTERVSDVDAALQESKTEKTLRVRYKDDFRSSTSRPMSKNELLWFFKTQYGFQFETDPEFVMVQEGKYTRDVVPSGCVFYNLCIPPSQYDNQSTITLVLSFIVGSLTSIPRCDMVSVNIGLKSQSLFGNQTQNYPSLSESELLIVWTQAKEKLYAVKEVQRIKKQKVISEKPAAQIVIPRFKKRKVASEKSLAQSVPEKSNNQHKRPVQKKPFNEREPIKMIDQTALKKGNDKEKSPVTLEALVEKEPSEEGTFKTMKIAQLKEYLRSRNQKVSGNKTILLERIQSIL